MEIRSYNQELAISNLLFKRVFQNIQIQRDATNGRSKLVQVNCQFGQKSRILKSWQNAERRAQMKLPMIIINRTGYSRDTGRLNGLHNEVKFEITSKNRLYDYLTPVPISISYEVTVVSKYPSDIDQIASNFMVFFNSSLFVSCIHPKYDGIKMNNQVIMEDSVSEEHPDEFDGTQNDLITSSFSFTFKTFLFGGMKQAKKQTVSILSSVISTYVQESILPIGYSDVSDLVERYSSVVISATISSDSDPTSISVVQVDPLEVEEFKEKYPDASLSADVEEEVTGEVSVYVDSDILGDTVYEEFTPIVRSIHLGFYPVPQASSFEDQLYQIENFYKDVNKSISGYISSKVYLSGFDTRLDEKDKEYKVLSSLTPQDLYYEKVDTASTLDPFIEKAMIWTIKEAT